jgi:hypothetical protein
MAKGTAPADPSITLLRVPPILMVESG